MEPEIYWTRLDKQAAAKFQRWQTATPRGYYLNRVSERQCTLHQETCPHIGGPGAWDPRDGDVTGNAKICHGNEAGLLSWATRENVIVARCSDCLK